MVSLFVCLDNHVEFHGPVAIPGVELRGPIHELHEFEGASAHGLVVGHRIEVC